MQLSLSLWQYTCCILFKHMTLAAVAYGKPAVAHRDLRRIAVNRDGRRTIAMHRIAKITPGMSRS